MLKRKKPHPSLCMLYQRGKCKAAAKCNQVHAHVGVVAELRTQGARDCCLAHGDIPSNDPNFLFTYLMHHGDVIMTDGSRPPRKVTPLPSTTPRPCIRAVHASAHVVVSQVRFRTRLFHWHRPTVGAVSGSCSFFPWTLSLHRRWCPSASHHPVSFLFLLAQFLPLYFPCLSLGRLRQRSLRTFPVSLLCVGSTQRRATALAVGHVRPTGHPKPAVRNPSPMAGGGGGGLLARDELEGREVLTPPLQGAQPMPSHCLPSICNRQ